MNRIFSKDYYTHHRTLRGQTVVTIENALEVVQVVLYRGGIRIPVDPAWDEEDVISSLLVEVMTEFLGKPIGGTVVFLRLWWMAEFITRTRRDSVESNQWRASISQARSFAQVGETGDEEGCEVFLEGREGDPREQIDNAIDAIQFLSLLSHRSRKIVSLRMKGKTYRAIGEEVGLTHEGVRQHFLVAVDKCRKWYLENHPREVELCGN